MPELGERRDPTSISSRIAGDLDRLRAQSQLRTLERSGGTGINLCSNDYLGLAVDLGRNSNSNGAGETPFCEVVSVS